MLHNSLDLCKVNKAELYLILVTSTSTRIVASVLKSRSKIRFPSLVVGNGNWSAFLAGKTCVEGISIRRRAFLCIPFIPSSNPGNSWPSPIVQASSLNSVSSLVEKYLTPPGSFCVANGLYLIVSSTETLDPSWTTICYKMNEETKGTAVRKNGTKWN